jgi:hypothetical protein
MDHKPIRYLMNTDTDQILKPITRSGDVSTFLFYFEKVTMPIGLIHLIH